MEVLDTIFAWQVEESDLVQFQTWDEDGEYLELFRVHKRFDVEDDIVITGESQVKNGVDEHILDRYTELEVMGA
jgi:hypothetical protein